MQDEFAGAAFPDPEAESGYLVVKEDLVSLPAFEREPSQSCFREPHGARPRSGNDLGSDSCFPVQSFAIND